MYLSERYLYRDQTMIYRKCYKYRHTQKNDQDKNKLVVIVVEKTMNLMTASMNLNCPTVNKAT